MAAPVTALAPYTQQIDAAAQQYKVPPNLLRGILYQESGGNPYAVNPTSGAEGIAQFMPDTANGFGINPMDPNQAIPAAAKYFRSLLDEFGGNVDYALAAYNAGPGNVEKYNGVPPFKETQAYVKSVENLRSVFDEYIPSDKVSVSRPVSGQNGGTPATPQPTQGGYLNGYYNDAGGKKADNNANNGPIANAINGFENWAGKQLALFFIGSLAVALIAGGLAWLAATSNTGQTVIKYAKEGAEDAVTTA